MQLNLLKITTRNFKLVLELRNANKEVLLKMISLRIINFNKNKEFLFKIELIKTIFLKITFLIILLKLFIMGKKSNKLIIILNKIISNNPLYKWIKNLKLIIKILFKKKSKIIHIKKKI